MSALLEIDNLHLSFRLFEGVSHVLNGIDLRVERGERVAIVGESGCGKSVTVRLILGLLRQANTVIEGGVAFNGIDLLTLKRSRLRDIRGRRICAIFQDPMASLNPTYRVFDQMRTVIRRGDAHRDAYATARDALKEVAITDPERVLAAYPFQLSGGLNQRVLIAMSLVNQPDLILADEPGTALDVTVQEQTLLLMRRLTEQRQSSVLLITHNLGVVRAFADRVYIMYAGNIVEQAPTARLFASPRHPYTQALLASVPSLSGDHLPEGIDGMIPDYLTPPEGCRFHPRCPSATAACRRPQPLRTVGNDHLVACNLYQDGRDV